MSDRILGEQCASIYELPSVCNIRCSDYPYTTVPNQVQRIFKAQLLHDKKHYDARMSATPEAREKMPYVDYLRPIIADGDTGYEFIDSFHFSCLYAFQPWWTICCHETDQNVC